MNTESKKPSCTEQVQKITKADLPLSCPTDDMVLWNAHPKVYLPIEKTGQETCPYCGTRYELIDK